MNTFEGSHFGSYKTYSLLVCEKGRAFFQFNKCDDIS